VLVVATPASRLSAKTDLFRTLHSTNRLKSGTEIGQVTQNGYRIKQF
jgi:hypothetical protein